MKWIAAGRVVGFWVVAASGVNPGLPAQDFDTALDAYKAGLRRPSLLKRTQVREALADTRDLRAFEWLRKDYRKAEEPREFVRSLLVSLAADRFGSTEHVELWNEWRDKQDDAEDVWLWLHALRIGEQVQPGTWREVATSRIDVPLRIAALEVGRTASKTPLPTGADLETLREVLDPRSSRGIEREWMHEAVLRWFVDAGVAAAEELADEHRMLLLRIADFMDQRRRSMRCRLALSRSFAQVLDCEDFGPDAELWTGLLSAEGADQRAVQIARARAAMTHTFFGIPEHGRRICYLIDASDSMLTPLTPREREALMPLTGGAARTAGKDRDRASDRAERAIDWTRVESRFDAARELLILALQDLPEDREFCVVLFGTDAEYLSATPRLVEADADEVAAACAALRAIHAGPPIENRPHGTLRGETNLHGALLAAYRTTDRKPVLEDPHVEAKAFNGGCDTIFLLSDGAPNWDDFDAVDENEDGLAGDPETGKSYEYDGEVIWYGPFVFQHHILADLRRLNLLRGCAIHAVGLGEADYGFLEKIAAIGDGRTLKIGVTEGD